MKRWNYRRLFQVLWLLLDDADPETNRRNEGERREKCKRNSILKRAALPIKLLQKTTFSIRKFEEIRPNCHQKCFSILRNEGIEPTGARISRIP
jgi:hypothetical protein